MTLRFPRSIRFAAALVVAIGTAVPAQAETLAGALVGAYKHSGLLDQNRALLRAADEDVAIAVAALRPILNYSYRLRRQFGRTQSGGFATTDTTLSLGAELLIYDGGASQYGIDSAKERVLAAREALVGAEQAVLLRAVAAYMNVRRQADIVALRDNNMRLLTRELRAANDRFEVGEVTRTDVALAEARMAQSRSQLAAAKGDLADAQEEYRDAVGARPGALALPPTAPRGAVTSDEARAIARNNHPDILRAQHQVAAAESDLARARASLKPRVRVTGSLSTSDTFDSGSFTNSGSVGLEASGPIYSGGAASAQIRKAAAQRDAQRANLHLVRHQIDRQVGEAINKLIVRRASRVAFEEQVRASQTAFRGVREEATLGARTTLDVLNAEQELLDARSGLISAQTDEYIAAYELLAAMGKLTVDYLDLPVQRYDPAAYYKLVKDAPAGLSKQGQALDRVLKSIGKN